MAPAVPNTSRTARFQGTSNRSHCPILVGIYCEGVGSWASYSNNNKPWGRRWTLPYHICGTVKSRLGSRRHRRAGEKRRKRGPLLLARARLSSYLCRSCTTCVNPSMLGLVSTPPHHLFDIAHPIPQNTNRVNFYFYQIPILRRVLRILKPTNARRRSRHDSSASRYHRPWSVPHQPR